MENYLKKYNVCKQMHSAKTPNTFPRLLFAFVAMSVTGSLSAPPWNIQVKR